jgi:hypothetical protein
MAVLAPHIAASPPRYSVAETAVHRRQAEIYGSDARGSKMRVKKGG